MLAAAYREFPPCSSLSPYVRAYFTYSVPARPLGNSRKPSRHILFPECPPCTSPLFADGNVSIVFSFGESYRVEGLWAGGHSGHVIGAITSARLATHGDAVVQVGTYLRTGRSSALTHVPASELTDRIVSVDDVWRSSLEDQLGEVSDDCQRVSLLESALLERVTVADQPISAALARFVDAHAGQLSVEQLADAAGISRQCLARRFREEVGVPPKLYARLARFRGALSSIPTRTSWAERAAALGYSDQSHLIADFRQFSGLTPAAMAAARRFHPFAE